MGLSYCNPTIEHGLELAFSYVYLKTADNSAMDLITGYCPGLAWETTTTFDPKDLGALGPQLLALPTESAIDQVIECSEKAQLIWNEVNIAKRVAYLLQLAEQMEKHAGEIAALDSQETGRSVFDLETRSIPKAVETLRWFCRESSQISLETKHAAFTEAHQPLGVCLAILPWNDPMVVTIWKLAPALLMGNSIVLKPSEYSTRSAIWLAQRFTKICQIDHVVTVVVGPGRNLPERLVESKKIAGVFFTGSAATARQVIAVANRSIQKPVFAETGGKGACVVTDLCQGSLIHAAQTLAAELAMNQGQICSAPSRVIVHKTLKDRFMDAYVPALETFKPVENKMVGHMVTSQATRRVQALLERQSPPVELQSKFGKSCIEPFAIEVSDLTAEVWQTELFAPVSCVFEFEDLDDAVEAMNSTDFGLANGVFSDNTETIRMLAHRSYSGVFHVNSWGGDDIGVPFGGVGDSGTGKEKCAATFLQFTRSKVISHP